MMPMAPSIRVGKVAIRSVTDGCVDPRKGWARADVASGEDRAIEVES